MQWSFLPGEQVHRTSGPIEVLYLLSRRSLKVKLRGPVCPTRNKVMRDATSIVLSISTDILLRQGCDRDILQSQYRKFIVNYSFKDIFIFTEFEGYRPQIHNTFMKQVEQQTHQVLIRRIKEQLSLPNLQSSFVSRHSILTYIQKLHIQNQGIRDIVDPPSIQKDVQQIQNKCRIGLEKLFELEAKQKKFNDDLIKLKSELWFIESHKTKNQKIAKDIQDEIDDLLGNKGRKSQSGERIQMESLFGKFLNYFQENDSEKNEQIIRKNGEDKNKYQEYQEYQDRQQFVIGDKESYFRIDNEKYQESDGSQQQVENDREQEDILPLESQKYLKTSLVSSQKGVSEGFQKQISQMQMNDINTQMFSERIKRKVKKSKKSKSKSSKKEVKQESLDKTQFGFEQK